MTYASRRPPFRLPVLALTLWYAGHAGFPGLSPALAHASRCTYRALVELIASPYDSAVELELNQEWVANLLTTTDGTIGPVIHGRLGPESLRGLGKRLGYGENELARIPWDKLTPSEKKWLIEKASAGQDFFQNRKIPGLTIKKQLEIALKKPVTILGKQYEPGAQVLPLGDFLHPTVEFRGAGDLLYGWTGVELHFRTRATASENHRSARALLDALGLPPKHQHIHIVGRIPEDFLLANPKVHSAVLGDFFRRGNLAAEMQTILEKGTSIKDNEDFFESLSSGRLAGVTQYFKDVGDMGLGYVGPIQDRFKMGWIGMRGADKYDQPGLWGLEYRAIAADEKAEQLAPLLDALQFGMVHQSYGVTPERMERWLSFVSQGHPIGPVKAVQDSWYKRPWPELLPRSVAKAEIERFELAWDDNIELKMLYFDWSKDPMFFDRPKAIEKIRRAQSTARQAFETDPKRALPIMQKFIRDSGILDETLRTLGVQRGRTAAAKRSPR